MAVMILVITAWLFKTSLVVYAPSLFLSVGFLLFFSESGGRFNPRNVVLFSGSILFLLAFIALWSSFGVSGCCQANLSGMILRVFSDVPVRGGISFPEFAARVLSSIFNFAITWKMPVTVVALLGCLAFIRHRVFWIILLSVSGFWLALYVGVVSGIAACFTEYEISNLASVQRYSRVPLRLTQTIGVFLLLFATISYFRKSSLVFPNGKVTTLGLIGILIALVSFQGIRSSGIVKNIEVRTNVASAFKQKVWAAKNDVDFLLQVFNDKAGRPIRILYLAKAPFVERVSANFHGLGNRRAENIRRLIADSYDSAAGSKTYLGFRPDFAYLDAVAITTSAEEAIKLFPSMKSALKNCVAGNSGYLLYRMKPRAELVCRPRMAP
ncbi:MAG: hypothetical protein ACPGPC_04440 [Alphaproteobacteria bacterium]